MSPQPGRGARPYARLPARAPPRRPPRLTAAPGRRPLRSQDPLCAASVTPGSASPATAQRVPGARPRGASPRGSPRPGWAVRGRAREPRTPPESPAARPAAPGPRAWLLAPRRAPRPPSRARASRSPGNAALRALTPCFPLGFPAPHYFPPVTRMSLPSTKTHHNTAAEVKMSTD